MTRTEQPARLRRRVRRLRPRTRSVWAALAAPVLALAATGAALTAGSAASAATPQLSAPLSIGTTTGDGTWAVAAMGQLSDPVNTFWQLFFRPPGSTRWTLATPPGVADNGGLTVAETGGALTVGFDPSQGLRFSPLAITTDGGGSWAPGIVPAGLAAVPDALAGRTGPALLALVRQGGGQVLAGTTTGSRWTVLAGRSALQRSGAGTCAVSALSAVAVTPGGTPLVGASCAAGTRVGVFARVAGRWREAGPVLNGRLAGTPTTVLRMSLTGNQVSALVDAGGTRGRGLVAMWLSSPGSNWGESATLHVPENATVRSTAIGPSGEVTVLLGAPGGPASLWQSPGPGRPWTQLAPAPRGTSTIAVPADGTVDAMVAQGTSLTVFELAPGTSTWQETQTLSVPIAYGSSS